MDKDTDRKHRQRKQKGGTNVDIQISVRNLVEFIFREGDIDNRHAASPDAMQDGSRIHRMIQKRMGLEYEAEVPLRYIVPYENLSLIHI